MHAVGYRPHLSFVVLALVTLGALAVATVKLTPRSCPAKSRIAKPRIECPHTREYSFRLADAWYRGKRFDAAARTLREAAKCEPVRIAEELHVIASFHEQLGASYQSGLEGGPSTRTIQHWDRAIQFDSMMGGA